jgi:putative MATE family efflux protein
MNKETAAYSNKQIWNVSFPIMIGLLAQNVINVTDTAFLGHVGEVELGASALGGIYYVCFFTIFFGFSTGAQIIISRRNGEKKYDAIGPVMIQGAIFLLSLAALIVGLSKFFSGDVMRFMISSEVIWDATMTYVNWRMFCLFFGAISVMFRAFYVGIMKTKVLTVNAIILAVANVILDWLLIFGNLGFPEMGIEGAAIASIFAELIAALFLVTYSLITSDLKKYGFARIISIDFKLLKHVLSISIYTMFQYFISMGTFFLFFIVIERQGQHALAIANIVRSIYIVMFIPINALSATTNTLVSNIIGEGKIAGVMPLIRRISRFSFFTVTGFVLLLCLFSTSVLAIYTKDWTLINSSVPSIYAIAGALIFGSIACVYFYGISGTGNTKSALILELGVLSVYIVYIYLTGIVYKLPVHICLIAEIVYFVSLLIGSMLYLRFANWKKIKI